MRAALIFTGHLRGTCDRDEDKGLRTLQQQAEHCRAAFDVCDIFLHTWDWLEKPLNFSELQHGPRKKCGQNCRTAIRLNASSWPCVSRVVAALNPAAVTVERQDRWQGYEVDARQLCRDATKFSHEWSLHVRRRRPRTAPLTHHEPHIRHGSTDARGSGLCKYRPQGSIQGEFLTNRSWFTLRSTTASRLPILITGR